MKNDGSLSLRFHGKAFSTKNHFMALMVVFWARFWGAIMRSGFLMVFVCLDKQSLWSELALLISSCFLKSLAPMQLVETLKLMKSEDVASLAVRAKCWRRHFCTRWVVTCHNQRRRETWACLSLILWKLRRCPILVPHSSFMVHCKRIAFLYHISWQSKIKLFQNFCYWGRWGWHGSAPPLRQVHVRRGGTIGAWHNPSQQLKSFVGCKF